MWQYVLHVAAPSECFVSQVTLHSVFRGRLPEQIRMEVTRGCFKCKWVLLVPVLLLVFASLPVSIRMVPSLTIQRKTISMKGEREFGRSARGSDSVKNASPIATKGSDSVGNTSTVVIKERSQQEGKENKAKLIASRPSAKRRNAKDTSRPSIVSAKPI